MRAIVVVMVVLAGCVDASEVHPAYPPSTKCSSFVAIISDVGYAGKTGDIHATYGDAKLVVIDLATRKRVLELGGGWREVGITPSGEYWLWHGRTLEARDGCTGAVTTDLPAILARHPEVGHTLVSTLWDPAAHGIRIIDEHARDWAIDGDTFALLPGDHRGVDESHAPPANYFAWPGEPEVEDWALTAAAPAHLARIADMLASHSMAAPPFASALELFRGEILRDDNGAAIVDGPQSVLVAYHRDLVDPQLYVSRVARTGEVLWTRRADDFARPNDPREMHFRAVHVSRELGLVFVLVRTDLVAFDPRSGAVRWRMSLVD